MSVEFIFSLITAITSIVAVVILVFTLKQNSEMIENSTRPYIGIYGLSVFIMDRTYYIIIKNFGQSSARIESFHSDPSLNNFSKVEGEVPFSHIVGATIMPGNSFRAAFKFDVLPKEYIIFDLSYSCGRKKYYDTIPLKIDSNIGNFQTHQQPSKPSTNSPSNSDDSDNSNIPITPEAIIAETLQDMHIKSL